MLKTRLARAVTALALTLGVALTMAPPASATTTRLGDRSLATVLTSDGDTFDQNWYDYDIVTQAVLAVLHAKPTSPVKVLTQGDVPVTAFIPNDRAFQTLVYKLTGTRYGSERTVFDKVAGLGIDTVEKVLLYHVVPNATITYRQALQADGASLDTAAGLPLVVDVRSVLWWTVIFLVDQDPDARNAWVLQPDINEGNLQIAHGVTQVLRPFDL